MTRKQRIVLIGFSGSGKSSVGRLLAANLGWRLIDTDADIERNEGRSVPDIFAQYGESRFRALERSALLRALDSRQSVIATGGGAVTDPELWTDTLLRNPESLVVTLDVEPETVLSRLRAQAAAEGEAVARPMLAGDDPLGRIRMLKEQRQPVYDQADITLISERIPPAELAAEIAALADDPTMPVPAFRLDANSASSEIYVAPNCAAQLGTILTRTWPTTRRAWVISDESVARSYAEPTLGRIKDAGLESHLVAVPVGESSKSWQVAGQVLDRLLDGAIERRDVVVALGGGVIGDLAGFVAATVLRGVPLIQVPTSLLAMVDSSIGGKTGINHRTGKNLIGVFYQPPVVIVDPSFLQTLPPRELNAGWAEIIKHAVIQPSTPGGERGDLLRFLERNQARLKQLAEPATTYLIRRNLALKAAVVTEDERETGIRAFLNFGHTLGHAIEASDYKLLHGEAIALGIRAVFQLANNLDAHVDGLFQRVTTLLDAFDLPRSTALDVDVVMKKLGSDKKKVAGKQRWVIPTGSGRVEIRDDVPLASVTEAIEFVTTASRESADSLRLHR